jgi:tRNA-modifying protein YgfZ
MAINNNIVCNLSRANILCELSHLGLLEVRGTDALTFLQGQVTNDVKLLTMSNNAHFSGYCNPKGRLLALFLAFYHKDHFHLQFSRELLEPIMKRLKMYVMRSKVEIKDVSESIVKFGVNGSDAASILASHFTDIPSQDFELSNLENAVILKLPNIGNDARFEVFTDTEHATDVFNTLKERCQLVEKPYWDWLEIQAGIPEVVAATQEQFVPQMLNLDILNGINFKKGCYTGQEIVARTHYLGSVKRRTYLAELTFPEHTLEELATKETPKAGDKVVDAAQNEVGQIVRVAANKTNGFDALIEMRIDAALAGNISWNSGAIKIAIKFKDLPYSLEN